MEPFFLIVAARRVANCLLYSSYTARFHPGMQTRSSASSSDVASIRLSQAKSDLGVIISHFVRQLEGALKTRFQTLRPSLEKSGGVLKLEPFFSRCRALQSNAYRNAPSRGQTRHYLKRNSMSIPNQIVINRFWGCTSVTFPSTNKTRSARESFFARSIVCQRRQAACVPPSVLGFVEGPFIGGPLASGCCASFRFHVSYMARNHKQKKSSKL